MYTTTKTMTFLHNKKLEQKYLNTSAPIIYIYKTSLTLSIQDEPYISFNFEK